MKKCLFILLISVFTSACWDDNNDDNDDTGTFLPGKGTVIYTGYEPLEDKPVRIHYYIPENGDMTAMPILMVFPGTNRNANDYLNAWIDIARNKKVMVFALEFPSGSYSTSEYIEGGMFSGNTLLPENQWTFSIIEVLFDKIRQDTRSGRNNYDLFGHSAGAQFVHRFMTFKPDNRVDRAVSANAGWYTVPDFTINYPYGLKNSPATQAGLVKFFAKSFILQLGVNDNDPNDSSLNHSAGADAQGLYRYARGLHYWQKALAAKNAGSYTFNWVKYEEQGIAHEYAKMSRKAGEILY